MGAIDLISFLLSAIGENSQKLMVQTPFLTMLYELLSFKHNLVKQYVFALLGDSQKFMSDLFRSCIVQFASMAVEHIAYDESQADYSKSLAVCNNACWFLGQVIGSRNGD